MENGKDTEDRVQYRVEDHDNDHWCPDFRSKEKPAGFNGEITMANADNQWNPKVKYLLDLYPI